MSNCRNENSVMTQNGMERMPLRLKTRCRYPGCGVAVRGTYCDAHSIDTRAMDRGRGSAAHRGYDAAWGRVANARRRLDCHLCQECLKKDRVTMSSTVDHIIPIYVRTDWRLEIENTQVLCHRCHSVKTKEDIRRYGGRTQRSLSRAHIINREQAMRLIVPPRDAPWDVQQTGGG
jgi:5-methylcytosine-specific restriction enzyme A